MLGNLHDFRTIRKALSLLQRLGKTPTPVFYVAYPELAEGKAGPFCRFDAHMLLRVPTTTYAGLPASNARGEQVKRVSIPKPALFRPIRVGHTEHGCLHFRDIT